MRLIDADAYAAEMIKRQKRALERYEEAEDDEVRKCARKEFSAFIEAKRTLDKMPTVDAVPVVRCRECKHGKEDCIVGRVCDLGGYDAAVRDDFFCADGKRKEKTDEH